MTCMHAIVHGGRQTDQQTHRQDQVQRCAVQCNRVGRFLSGSALVGIYEMVRTLQVPAIHSFPPLHTNTQAQHSTAQHSLTFPFPSTHLPLLLPFFLNDTHSLVPPVVLHDCYRMLCMCLSLYLRIHFLFHESCQSFSLSTLSQSTLLNLSLSLSLHLSRSLFLLFSNLVHDTVFRTVINSHILTLQGEPLQPLFQNTLLGLCAHIQFDVSRSYYCFALCYSQLQGYLNSCSQTN